MTTRILTNVGSPLLNADGLALAGVSIKFTLVDLNKKSFIPTWHINGNRVILNTVQTVTDKNGEFSISLFPNDQLSPETMYLCQVDCLNSPFYSVLESGVDPKQWFDFFLISTPLTPLELTALQLHLADIAVHLTNYQQNQLLTLSGGHRYDFEDTIQVQVIHDLGYRPLVQVFSNTDDLIGVTPKHINDNRFDLMFNPALSGYVIY